MRCIFITGIEGRLLPSRTVEVGGEKVKILSHWGVTIVGVGVDRGEIKMVCGDPGVVTQGDTFEELSGAIGLVAHHFPIDGKDVQVRSRRAVSVEDEGMDCYLRPYHLWEPPQDLWGPRDEVPDVVVRTEEGTVTYDRTETDSIELPGHAVGMGVGIELREGRLYAAPYVGVAIYEDRREIGGGVTPLVVPARWMPPWDPSSEVAAGELARAMPLVLARLRSHVKIGDRVQIRITRTHYRLIGVYPKTPLGQAFLESRTPTVLEAAACR